MERKTKRKRMKKIILDLCGGTGSWSRPYKEAGYKVINVTLPAFDITKTQFYPNYMCIGGGKSFDTVWYKDVYGILAAPPCTMFSIARRTAKTPPDFKGAMEVVEACLMIIWQCRFSGSLKFWALENPMGLLRQFLGKPWYTFEQWEFGHVLSKRTDLWGYFIAPAKTVFIKPDSRDIDKEWQNPSIPDWLKDKKLNRTEIRSITPEGFARAFFRNNP